MQKREKIKEVPKETLDKWAVAMYRGKWSIRALAPQLFLSYRTAYNAIQHGIATKTTIDKLDDFLLAEAKNSKSDTV